MATEVARIVVPKATEITCLPEPHLEAVQGKQLRLLARPGQLQLSRSLTFGVLGEDSKLYPSSQWESENRGNFGGARKSRDDPKKSDLVATSLDTRKHNPQTTQLFHIRRIDGRKPVCAVSSWPGDVAPETDARASVYMSSFPARERQDRHIVRKAICKAVDTIIPMSHLGNTEDARAEMLLPVCDTTVIPSAHNPHRYLLRKRKVPPPYIQRGSQITSLGACGAVYPNLEIPRMSEYVPGEKQTGPLPFTNEPAEADVERCSERVSVSSLSGLSFSRRRFIQPPTALITTGFDGGAKAVESHKFDDKYLPFIRRKTII